MLDVIYNKYQPITLQELDKVKLLNRTDTKFLLSIKELEKVLQEVANDYDVLEIDGKRSNDYQTLYYDTADFDLYYKHHRGFVNRHKLRMRSYLDSNLNFIEIKHKVKGRTDKKRTTIPSLSEKLDDDHSEFIQNASILIPEDYEPKLYNQFTRVTLAHKTAQERVTLDFNLKFEWADKVKSFDQMVIAEIKQERVDRTTPIMQSLKQNQIRTERISKYCIGCVILYPFLKYNNFKPKLIKINKLHDRS